MWVSFFKHVKRFKIIIFWIGERSHTFLFCWQCSERIGMYTFVSLLMERISVFLAPNDYLL